MLRATRYAGPGKQEPQVIVNLGNGANRRAWIMRGGFLLDRDSRRQSVNMIDVGFFHHRQELPGVGRQGLDIAALTFSIDRVECQRRFAGSREAGEHDQLIPR